MAVERDEEPVTPAGRLFLRPELDIVINCVIGGKQPANLEAVKSEIANSIMINHPRFSSLLVRDRYGREHWRKTQIEIDRHLIIRHEPVGNSECGSTADDEDAVNEYLADLAVSSPLSTEKPLWEIHILMAHKCAILRVHHALGDGISLMSLFLACCRRGNDPAQLPDITSLGNKNHHDGEKVGKDRVWRRVGKVVWYTILFALDFVMRSLWVKDTPTAVSGGAGVELWPRKLATARFLLEDMKTVKRAVSDSTINDVLFAVVSFGLSKYINLKSSKVLKDGLRVTGLAMVNLRQQPGVQEISNMMRSNSGSRWGNKFGMVLLPVYCYKDGSDPLEYVKRAKKMIDQKKQSFEAHFSYSIGNIIMSCLGPKFASLLNYRIVCNTTFTISNVVGPREEIAFAGNPLTYIRATSTSLPHAITMHMVSYKGWADLQILVAKEIIPDPRVLANCLENALLEMKKAAEARSITTTTAIRACGGGPESGCL